MDSHFESDFQKSGNFSFVAPLSSLYFGPASQRVFHGIKVFGLTRLSANLDGLNAALEKVT